MGKGKIAVYAGTFDPVTNGHLDIVKRALKVFDTVYVAVAESTSKVTLFSGKERLALLKEAINKSDIPRKRSARVEVFDGLLADYVQSIGASVIVRGLRAVSDYEYEAQMAHINRYLSRDIETVFLVTSRNCSFISASIVKEIARNGGKVRDLVPSNVTKALRAVYASKQKK